MPNAVTISARSSSLTNSFVNSIIPVFHPSQEEIEEALAVLGMTLDHTECVYCGNATTEWDHLRPLVKNKRPTGYVSEIANLVPACGKCNQSKGGSDWRTWMVGPAKLSPHTRGVADLESRIASLERYEEWRTPLRVDFEQLAGGTLWTKHWDNHYRLMDLVSECQVTADEIKQLVRQVHDQRSPRSSARGAVRPRSRTDRQPRQAAQADVERLLRSVGYAAFVEYYAVFADLSLSTEHAIERLPQRYSEGGRRTRVNCARRIINGGMAREALSAIAASEAVDPATVRQAEQLLRELGSS
ncbi:MAG: HNH endonuclease [Coriobacteriia bacterium]|nr:HNH endonuclease [Coriobacteriia bacterium]